MKHYLVLAMLLFWSWPGKSQSAWTTTAPFQWQNGNAANCLTIQPTTSFLFVGQEEGGIMRSTDQGSSWEKMAVFPVFTISARADGVVFAGGEGVIYKSEDNGLTWTTHTIGNPHPVSKIVFNSSGHVYAATSTFPKHTSETLAGSGVLKSTDNGQNWATINNGLTGSLAVQVMSIDTQDRLYVGISDENTASGGGLYTMPANATTWQHLPVSFNNLPAVDVAYAEALITGADGTIYFSVNGSIQSYSVTGTFKSTDGGTSWSVLTITPNPPIGLSHTYLTGMTIARNGTLWGTLNSGTQGIYHSTDQGTTWTRETGNVSISGFSSFAENADGQLFVLKDFSNTVMKRFIPLSSPESAEPTVILVQAYPNPFLEELKISYSLQTRSPVCLQITDTKGRVVFRQEKMAEAGEHTEVWKPTVAAGIYAVQVQTGISKRIQKVILLK